jgi:hypothetical protein
MQKKNYRKMRLRYGKASNLTVNNNRVIITNNCAIIGITA